MDWAAWAVSDEDCSPRRSDKVAVLESPRSDTKPGMDQHSDSASTAATDEDDKRTKLPFPVQEFTVNNTFIELSAPAAWRRSDSCPPRIRTPCTVMLRHIPNRAKQARIEEHLSALGFPEY